MPVNNVRFRHRHGSTMEVETDAFRAGDAVITITTVGGYLQQDLDAEQVAELRDWLNQHFPVSPANSLP